MAETSACHGVVVVDFSEGMPGPLATMILADNGATVIKVEPPSGDWIRPEPGFHMWNRAKRSVVLDHHRGEDVEVARGLVARSDVVVEGPRGRLEQRFGIDDELLAKLNPAAILCSISGGLEAEPATQKVHEGTEAAATGRFIGVDHVNGAVPGQDREAPIFVAAPIASYGAALLAVQGILAALLERRRSGTGRRVRTSLLKGATAFLMRQEMPRGDSAHSPIVAPISEAARRGIELCFMTAECRDGKYIQMCARQDHHFHNWLRALGLEDLLSDPVFAGAPLDIADVAAADVLDAKIRARMRERTQAEWMGRFINDFDVGADPFLTPTEFLAHPDMIKNDRIVEIDDPEVGMTTQLGPLAFLSESGSTIGAPAPRLGEHDAEIRAMAIAPESPPAASRPVKVEREYPLAGTTILEVAYFIAGPLATSLLVEMGARVIKVEPHSGDPYRRTGLQSAKFLHGKESIAIDLKQPDGVALLHQLAKSCDAFVHSFRPGVPERLGLDYETLAAINPRLVYLYAAAYGSRGPQRHRIAFHSTPTALSGGGFLQAGEGNPPVDDSYPDPGSALGAATAMLLGLLAREGTGRGQYVETTMLCSTGYILSNDLVEYDGVRPQRLPDRGQHGFNALYRLFRAREGWVFVGIVDWTDWPTFARMLGHDEWIEDERFSSARRRNDHDNELVALIAAVLATRPAEKWDALARAAGLPVVAVCEATFDVWLEAQGLLTPAEHPSYGSYWYAPNRVDFDGVGVRSTTAASVGEHGRSLLAELGYDRAAIDDLLFRGVVLDPHRVPAPPEDEHAAPL